MEPALLTTVIERLHLCISEFRHHQPRRKAMACQCMAPVHTFVAVLDEDVSVREALPDLLRECGYQAEGFASAEAFLGSGKLEQTGCLVLDSAMPGVAGPAFQRALIGWKIPIIVITAHGDTALCPRVRRLGVVECLHKPFRDTALLEALQMVLGSR
jgi:FixJ family two-component response regulator